MAATRGHRVAAILLLAWACSSTEDAIERFEVRRPTQNFELRRPTPQEAFSPDRKAVPWTNLVLTCESKAFNCKMSVWQDRQR